MNDHSVALAPPILPPWPGPALPPVLTELAAALNPDVLARTLWARWSGRGDSGRLVGSARRTMTEAANLSIPFGSRSVAGFHWPGRGPRVLLIHGWSGRAATLAPLLPTLKLEDLDVVACDAPGCGDSPGRRGTIATLVDAVAAVDRHVGGVDVVIAHGAGAAAALAALGSARAHRWALLAPSDAPKVVASWCAHIGGARGRDLFSAFDGLVRSRLGVGSEHYDLDRLARSAAGRLLVAHDQSDRAAPFDHGRAVVDLWPGATLVATHGVGHQGIVHDVDVHVALHEYLRTM